MNKVKSNEILSILREIIINPKSELNYNNTYELLIAVMLSAQTTDERVNLVTKNLFIKYPDVVSLSNAQLKDVSVIIKSVGLYKTKAKNIIDTAKMIVEKYNCQIPSSLNELKKLPGVGEKTASVVLIEGFNIPAMPVDTHLYRLAIRLKYINEGDDIVKAQEAYKKYIDKTVWKEAHHLFLLYGRYYCKSKNPKCLDCKLQKYCSYYK